MFVMAMVSFTVINAAPVKQVNSAAVTQLSGTDQDKVEVKPEDLPEAVKTTLASEPYNEWKVEKAYAVTTEDGKSYYEINLSKGEETATVNLDKDGKKVE